MGGNEGHAGAMLAEAMDRAEVSNAALAQVLDVRPSMVSMMRSGRMDIPVCRVAGISSALGIDATVLAGACVRSYPDSRTWQAYAMGRASSLSGRPTSVAA